MSITKILTKTSLAAASVMAALTIAVHLPVLAATSVVVVTPSDLEDSKIEAMTNSSWFIYNDETDTIDNTLATFVVGPETPPLGEDSVEISVSGTERVNLATYQFSNTPLADISTLSYNTYNASAGNAGSVNRSGYLQFNVDFDGSDTWQRRMLFLPSDNGVVVQDEWQAWDTINNGDALWRYSGPTWPGTVISGTTPRTWNDILASYPGVSVRETDAFMGIRVGEPYADGYTENLDAFTFGTADGETTFDFELVRGPMTKEECRNGGYLSFVNADGNPFKNQGQCVSSVASQNAPGKIK